MIEPSPASLKSVRFGLFEADLSAGELRKRGRKIALQDQPFQVLALLLQRPRQVVTREELQQAIWSADTFVEFDQSLNKAIQKIRQALGDSADNPRFIETLPRKGYRFIAPVEGLAGEAAGLEDQAPRRNRRWLWLLVAGVVLAAGGGVAWWRLSRPSGNVQLTLTQLTTDAGLTYQPALSPDGKLLAYASDRGGEGNLDIWVQQVPRGEPIRVTHHEADDYEPSFSPDGRSIVFRSDREGGGIYVVPALGGEARKIAERGRRPRYSPDGEWIAYWEGPRHLLGRIYVVASAGGQPKPVFSGSEYARSPVWTPDGKHLLLWGDLDWRVTPLDGGPVVTTGVMEVLDHRGLSGTGNNPFLLYPEAWLEGNQVVFSARSKSGDSTDLWKISLSPNTWQVASEPQRLTVGSGLYRYASASEGGRLVFSSLTRNPDVWSLPVDANRGIVAGEMQQLTHEGADDVKPSVSLDGKRMVFESNRTGKRVVWTKDLETGKEQALTGTPSSENLPVISADGSEVVYVIAHWPSGRSEMFVIPFEGGPPKRVCDDACVQPVQWSSDGSKILYNGDNPPHVALLDIRTGQKVKLVSHPNLEIYGGGFTPDQRWISFGCGYFGTTANGL